MTKADEQVGVAENQVKAELVPKPEYNLLVVIFEACPLTANYIDQFWEAVQQQQKAFEQVFEVRSWIGNSILVDQEGKLKRLLEIYATQRQLHKKRKRWH